MSALTPIRTQHPAAELAERRWSELKSERGQEEAEWARIAELFRPERGGFGQDDHTRRERVQPLSSGPLMARANFSAGLFGTLTNSANKWMGFTTSDPDVNEWHPAKLWLDQVSSAVLGSFMPSVSSFYPAASQLFDDLPTFGTAAQYDEVVPDEGKILDITLSLAEVVYDIDGFGRVVEVVRKFHMKPAAAMGLFGSALPPKIQELAQKGAQDRLVFYHHITRNDDWRKGMLGVAGKRWTSRYSCEVERTMLREGGYHEMPFYPARWDVETGSIYGRGLGHNALASARAHQLMDEAVLRNAQFGGDPTLLAPDRGDWPLNGRVRPGSLVYGGLNSRGEVMLRTLERGNGVTLTLEERREKMNEIRDAWHYMLMNLAGRTGMTATEVMTINEERQRLWAPNTGRVQVEFLAPKADRRFSLLWRAGQLPPPPDGLPEGLKLSVTYLSAAASVQRSTEGTAALRVLEDISPLMAIKPRLADRIDEDGLLETLMDARGAPARMVRSRDDADAIAEQRAKQQQAMAAIEAAKTGAGALKDAAGAAAALQGGQGVPA